MFQLRDWYEQTGRRCGSCFIAGLVTLTGALSDHRALAQCERTELQRIENPVPQYHAYFGWQVAMTERFVFASAVQAQTADAQWHGRVHVFLRTPEGLSPAGELVPRSPANVGRFGHAVVAEGNRVVVGAPFEWQTGYREGAVYVFEHDGKNWLQTARLTPSDAAPDRSFGSTLALEDDTIIVGNEHAFIGSPGDALYVFQLEDGVWTEKQRISPPFAPPYGRFGYSIDFDGTTIAVGSPVHPGSEDQLGRVDLLNRQGDKWTWTETLATQAEDAWFGRSVSLGDDLLVIGAPRESNDGMGTGAAYIYRRVSGRWIQAYKVTLPASEGHPQHHFHLGAAVLATESGILVGAEDYWDSAAGPGKTYLFRERAGSWVPAAKLTMANAQVYGWFGVSIAECDDVAVIAARAHSTDGLYASGAFGVFDISEPRGLVRYVDAAAAPGGDGSSWAQAANDLSQTLDDAGPGDELWIAQGLYKPAEMNGRQSAFELPCNLKLFGGFPTGGGDGTFDARDPARFETVLSADIGVPGDQADNCYNVIRLARYDGDAVTEGVTIRDANSIPTDRVVIERQGAISGALTSVALARCVVTNNIALNGGGLNVAGGSVWIDQTSFSDNRAEQFGGAIHAESTSIAIHDSKFEGNSAARVGALFVSGPVFRVVNTQFTGNTAASGAGAVLCVDPALERVTAEFDRCTFANNSGFRSGALNVTARSVRVMFCSFIDNISRGDAGGA